MIWIYTTSQNIITGYNQNDMTGNTGWSVIDSPIPDDLTDERGIYRYKLVDGVVLERTQEEMDADYTPPEPQPDLAQQVKDLQEALDLLLSGEVSEDG